MDEIYMVIPSNRHGLIVPVNTADGLAVAAKLHRGLLSPHWMPLEMTTVGGDEKAKPAADLASCDFGGLLLRDRSTKAIVAGCESEIELLPVHVDEEPWYLVNCLKHADAYDKNKSSVWTDSNGCIYMINFIKITDSAAKIFDLFTIGPSNRTSVLVSRRLKDRVEQAGLSGVEFRRIGFIV